MGPSETWKFLHSKGNHEQDEKTALRAGKSIANAAQYKKKNKQPNQKMGIRPKQLFLQRRHTDGQPTHKKILDITSYQRNANPNYSEILPLTYQNGHHL